MTEVLAHTPASALELVEDVVVSITSSLHLEQTLQLIVDRTGEAFDCYECTLYEFKPETNTIVAASSWSRDPEDQDNAEWPGTVLSLADHPTYARILERKQIVEYTVEDDDLPEDERREMEAWGEKTCLSVPLFFRDEIIGCLDLIERRWVRRFTDDELKALASLAVPAAIAVHNARLYRAQQDRTLQLASVIDATRAITSMVVFEDVLEMVAERTAVALGSPQCLIYEYDPDQDAIISRALYEAPGHEDPTFDGLGTVYPLDDYPSDRAIMQRRDLIQEHLSDCDLVPDSRETMDRFSEKSVLTAPLYFGDEPLGQLLLIETEHERRFTPDETKLVQALAEQAAVAIHNARLFRQQERQNNRLVALAEVSQSLSASRDAHEILSMLLAAIPRLFPEWPITTDLWMQQSGVYVPFVAAAAPETAADALELPREFENEGEGSNGNGHGSWRPDRMVQEVLRSRAAAEDADGHRGRRLVVPVTLHADAVGYLDVRCFRRTPLSPDEVQVVEILANHAAVALENAGSYRKLETMYFETVQALAAAMEAKDHYTAEHADMLASMAVAVGTRMGLSAEALRDVQYAAVLHDIGKIGIPGNILNKPDKLTDEEFAVMAQHTIIGERIIANIDYLAPIAGIIRSAHERWDGRGYPDKLAQEQIPLASRILLVCDAYHAMTSDRPYRPAMPEHRALEELRRNAGSQFDPRVIDAFLKAWPEFSRDEAQRRPLRVPSLLN